MPLSTRPQAFDWDTFWDEFNEELTTNPALPQQLSTESLDTKKPQTCSCPERYRKKYSTRHRIMMMSQILSLVGYLALAFSCVGPSSRGSKILRDLAVLLGSGLLCFSLVDICVMNEWTPGSPDQPRPVPGIDDSFVTRMLYWVLEFLLPAWVEVGNEEGENEEIRPNDVNSGQGGSEEDESKAKDKEAEKEAEDEEVESKVSDGGMEARRIRRRTTRT